MVKLQKDYYNFFPIKILYMMFVILIAIYWDEFRKIPSYYFTWAAVVWILNLYRNLNKDKTTIQNQFFIAFWVRMGWSITYSVYSTGHLYGDKSVFIKTLIQCFITTAIYTAIPLRWVQKSWSYRLYRWPIFMIDQFSANGLSFLGLMNKQIMGKNIIESILILTSKAIARPTFQIITGFCNNNLFWDNLRKWSTICYLNTCRILLIASINYWVINADNKEDNNWEAILQYFNVCYYGFVGYLMYVQSYTL